MIREALEGFQRVYGDDHPYTLTTIHSRAENLLRLGRFSDAEEAATDSYERHLARYGPDREETVTALELIARIGEESSVLMRDVARRMGAGYVHVLQPNQYLAHSKQLSDEEREHAISNPEVGRRVEAGYQALRPRIEAFERVGLSFVDMTQVFGDHPETLYRDSCCHLNLRGNELLAEAIVRAVPDQELDR